MSKKKIGKKISKHTLESTTPVPANLEFVGIDVAIDGTDQTVSVTASLTCDELGRKSMTMEETFNLDADKELAQACDALSTILLSRLRSPNLETRPLRCDSCVGACCIKYPQVIVYDSDVPALCLATGSKDLADLKKKGIVGGRASFGSVGYLGRAPAPKHVEVEGAAVSGAAKDVCVFLTWTKDGVARCGIYSQRPFTCRGFPEADCNDQSPPEPKLYKIRPAQDRKPTDRANPERINLAKFFNDHCLSVEVMK